jgi:class 3 adenylate cyclase
VRRELARYRGSEVKSLGDGFLATFDGPGRAVRCACAIAAAVQPLNIHIRCGLHAGEIEITGNDVQGVAVHIDSRVSALAAADEMWVSRTVKDLVAGSGLRFEGRGRHALKGSATNGTIRSFALRLGSIRGLGRRSEASVPNSAR